MLATINPILLYRGGYRQLIFKTMKKYLAFDAINCEYEEFETIKDAREWLEECFLDSDKGYHPDLKDCKIYELKETVIYNVIDKKENYKYENEEDIPEGLNEESWPYDNSKDEIWEHKFDTVS